MVTDRSTSASARLEPHDFTKETPARTVGVPTDSSIPNVTCRTIMPGEPDPPPALDWSDPVAVKLWARDVCTSARDAIGAGLDATRQSRKRQLGRAAARRIIADAGSKLDDAIKFACLDLGAGAR